MKQFMAVLAVVPVVVATTTVKADEKADFGALSVASDTNPVEETLDISDATEIDPSAHSCDCTDNNEQRFTAWLNRFDGRVFVTTPQGIKLAEKPTVLEIGSRVVVGEDGHAQVTLGNSCVYDLQANQELEIISRDGRACWQLSDLNFGFTQVQTTEGLLVSAPVVITGVAAASGAAAVLVPALATASPVSQ